MVRDLHCLALAGAFLSLASCNSAPPDTAPPLAAAQPATAPAPVEINVSGSPQQPGTPRVAKLTGPMSWETPLQWQVYDTFVTEGGKVHKVHGHKTKRVIVPVTLTNTDGSQVTLNFLVDTGADRTIINTTKVHANLKNAKVENCEGVGGMQQISLVSVPRLAVGELALENIELAFAEMPVDEEGLLGQDFLRRFSVTIDYRKAVFRLERSEPKKQ